MPRKPLPQQLRSLWNYSVPVGGILNPYGTKGYKAVPLDGPVQPAYREGAMKRKRLELEVKKAAALERHELQQIARENATAMMETLIEISKNKRAPDAARIAASIATLDRGYGKASQTSIAASVTNGTAKELNANELEKRIELALKRIEEVTTGTPKAGKSKDRPANVRVTH